MFHYHCRLLFIYKSDNFIYKLFRIISKHIKFIYPNALQNCRYSLTGKNCSFCHFAYKIILNLTCLSMSKCLCSCFFFIKGFTTFHFIFIHFRLLMTDSRCILKLRNKQLLINMSNCLFY